MPDIKEKERRASMPDLQLLQGVGRTAWATSCPPYGFQAALGWGRLKRDAGLGARVRMLSSLKYLPRVSYGLLASRALAWGWLYA